MFYWLCQRPRVDLWSTTSLYKHHGDFFVAPYLSWCLLMLFFIIVSSGLTSTGYYSGVLNICPGVLLKNWPQGNKLVNGFSQLSFVGAALNRCTARQLVLCPVAACAGNVPCSCHRMVEQRCQSTVVEKHLNKILLHARPPVWISTAVSVLDEDHSHFV